MPVPPTPDPTLFSQPSQLSPELTGGPGLLGLLENNGSILAYGAQPTAPTNGDTPSINPLSTNQSKLHAYGQGEGYPGYSYDGSKLDEVSSQYNLYNDGETNILPDPTRLDLNDPIGVPGFSPVYNGTNNYMTKAKALQNQPYIP